MHRFSHPLLPRRTAGAALAVLGTAVLVGLGTTSAQADTTPASPGTGVVVQSSTSGTSTAPATVCPTTVTITSVTIQKDLVGGQAVVTIVHDGQGCPDAKPATLHIHQNLVPTPNAGSDPTHQSNVNDAVGPDFGDSVAVTLLDSVPGKCFVQVDASAGTIRRGRFFPTATCTPESTPPTTPASSASSSASSSAATSSAAASTTPPIDRPSTPATSLGVSGVSTSRVPAQHTHDPVTTTPAGPQLAFTGMSVSRTVGLAALLIGSGAWLSVGARRPRRH